MNNSINNKRKQIIITILTMSIVFSGNFLFAKTDSCDKAIRICPKLGPVIDIETKERYGLFYKIDGFRKAVFFQTSDEKYFVKIRRNQINGLTADTTIPYSKDYLLMIGEQIQHYKEYMRGDYKLRKEIKDFSVIDTCYADIDSIYAGQSSGRSDVNFPGFPNYNANLDSFNVKNKKFTTSENDFKWVCLAGMEYISEDFSSAYKNIGVLEDNYRSEGFSISPTNSTPSPLQLSLGVGFRYKYIEPMIDVLISSAMKGTMVSLKLFVMETSDINPYIIGGIGYQSFSIKKNYNETIISRKGSDSAYTVLENITLSSANFNYSYGLGVEIERNLNIFCTFDYSPEHYFILNTSGWQSDLGKIGLNYYTFGINYKLYF